MAFEGGASETLDPWGFRCDCMRCEQLVPPEELAAYDATPHTTHALPYVCALLSFKKACTVCATGTTLTIGAPAARSAN